MEKVLNQDEIDAMFRAALGRDSGSAQLPEKVHPCDFRQAGQIKKDQVRAISSLHEGFARNLTHALGAYLRVVFDTNLVSVEQLTFREFLARVPDVAYLASFEVQPMGALAALELDLQLAFPMIDLLLGGRGRPSADKREVTEIEEQILEGVVRILCQELQTAWASINVTFDFKERLLPAQMQRLMPPSDKTLCLSFEIRMPESRGMLNVSLPAVVSNALLRILENEGGYEKRQGSREDGLRMKKHALDFTFPFELGTPELTVPVEKLLTMKAGDIIQFPQPANSAIIGLVARHNLYSALPVKNNTHRAARILQMFSDNPEEARQTQ